MNRARAFSLIEVMVSLAMAAVITSVTMQIFVDASKTGKRTRVRSELANNGAIVAQMLRTDLSVAGFGVPAAGDQDTNTKTFKTSLLVAGTTHFGIVGDLPRPDANFTPFGFISDESANKHHVTWHNENNGLCPVGSGCSTADFSQFFPGEDGCKTEADAKGPDPDRTCPWGLKRLRGGEPFQVVAATRRWFNADSKDPIDVHDHGHAPKGTLFIHTGNDYPAGWDANTPTSLPNAGSGQGWVTSLDRVFWRFDAGNRRLERIQCWGHPDPEHASWPAATATAVQNTPCAAPFQGMADYEVVATNVDSALFTYFDATGTAVVNPANASDKRRVRRVDFTIVFSDTVNDIRVEHETVGGVFMPMAL